MADGSGPPATSLVAVTTNAADSGELTAWLASRLSVDVVTTCPGFYSAVEALDAGASVVVVETSVDDDREEWRLAELRAHAPEATFLVVADATLLPALAGPVHADLAVTRTADLPPLRELLVSATPTVDDDQTSRRRSSR